MPMISARTRFVVTAAAAIALVLAVAPFAVTAGAQQRGRASGVELPRTPSDMGLHGYSVVLVVGDMQTSGGADTVPNAARKALTDLQAFLPYKRYQLLDAAWMICCGAFRSSLSGRVRGPDNGEYAYTVETMHQADEKKLTVRFTMRDAGASAPVVAAGGISRGGGGTRGAARGSSGSTSKSDADVRNNIRMASENERLVHLQQLYATIRERDELESALRTLKETKTDTHPQVVEATTRYHRAQARVDDLQHLTGGGVAGGGRGSAGRTVMDSTFSIALGETVVIGTSRLKGDQALIALLTAATKPGAAR